MRSELLLQHCPFSEETTAPCFSICVISWHPFLCCPELRSAFCPAIRVFLSHVSWMCSPRSLYKWCHTLLVRVFTWRNTKWGCSCTQESVGAAEHPHCCAQGALPSLPPRLLMEMSGMLSAFSLLLVHNSAVYLSLRNTPVFCEIV